MRNAPKAASKSSPGDSDIRLLAWLATCVSILSFLFYFRNGEVLLYGDAIGHINIARRVFDSKTPGLLQLGTVWLPLPHLLMIPFLLSKNFWRTGAGGSLPSMAAYVFGVVGIFRLTRRALARGSEHDSAARIAAWSAAVIYAANPNLIYMQSTAMSESLYLTLFIWAVVYFADALRGDAKALTRCGVCLAAACLTRYDGWFLAASMVLVVLAFALRDRFARHGMAFQSVATGGGSTSGRAALQGRVSRASTRALAPVVIRFVLIAAVAPILWLAYNGIVYRNPLEFANGPYSAKAIERRTQNTSNPGHPGSGNLVVAEMFFLKSSEANVAENEWLQRTWVLLVLAAIWVLSRRDAPRKAACLLLLLVPLPFYALSVAYSGVPIFIPWWWPFSHYNVRYGLQLLPAFATAFSALVCAILRAEKFGRQLRPASVIALFALAGISYASVWRAGPICLQEAQVNMRTRTQLEIQFGGWLDKLPPDSTLLVYLGDHVGAVERAGIPLKRTINEGNHRVWMQPSDPEGLWERALANPPQYADYALAFEGDPVWQAVHDLHLREVVEIHVTGQARGVLYRAR